MSPLESQERRLFEVCDFDEQLITGLEAACNLFGLDKNQQKDRAWLWLHLVELKDYLIPKISGAAS